MLWILLTLGVVYMLQSWLFGATSFKKLTYNRQLSKRSAFVGDHITMVESIKNGKALPVPWIKVESRMPRMLSFGKMDDLSISGDIYHRSVFYLGGHRKIKRTHYITCAKRGYAALSSACITTGHLFGQTNKAQDIHMDIKLSVYPKLLSFDEVPDMFKELMGDIKVKRWILPDPFLINGIRPYRLGDSYKDVHWGASAKTGELKVKTYDFSSSPKMLVLLNIEIREDHWGIITEEETPPIEYGLSLAATLILWAMQNGLEAGFGSNGYLQGDEGKQPIYVAPDRGERGIHTVLETMARLVIAYSESFHSYIETLLQKDIKDTDIIVLTNYESPRLTMQLDRLRAVGNNITVRTLEDKHHA